MELKIKNSEVALLSNAPIYEYPKYATMLINLVNRVAQGTRPKIVGQMSDLIQSFPGRTLNEWKKYYDDVQPTAIEDATDKICNKLDEMRKTMETIDRETVRHWVEDLVYTKTFCGLKVQQAIIAYIAAYIGHANDWRLADKQEESKGIDGFVGNIPVQVKADTYNLEKNLGEHFDAAMVHYKKVNGGFVIDFDINDFK